MTSQQSYPRAAARRERTRPRVSPFFPGVLLVVLMTAGALANPATEARYFDSRARTALSQGRSGDALDWFLRSHQASPSPGYAFNVAVAAMRARKDELAFAYFRDYQTSDDQNAARRAHAKESLQALLPRLALIQVDGNPPGATLYVDKRHLGSFGQSPRVLAVDPGRHRLIVEHEGHTPVALEFLATEGKTAEVRFDLAVLTGSLTVESPAGKLATLIDRQGERTQIPVGVSEEVPAKTYQVEIDAPGHYRATASTRVIAGKRSSVTLTPMPKVAAVGAISVETNLTGVKIYIDDELYAFAPVRIPSIVVGSHRIRFGLDDHTASLPGFLVREDGTFEVTVEEGATLSLRPTFRRKSAQ